MRTLMLALVTSFTLASAASAQRATEQFIPIGQSPGAVTMQGALGAVAEPAAAGGEASFVMTAAAADGAAAQERAYTIGPQTRIYVDRSALGQASTLGSMDDLRAGRVVEVCIADAASRVALWIKVRAEP